MTASSAAHIYNSIARGVDWLLEQQSTDGAWRDFWLPGGPSDEWVTAYVGAALAPAYNDDTRVACRHAWQFLTVGKTRTGWGYNSAAPSDADSMAWAVLFAKRLGVESTGKVRIAEAFLRASIRPSGIGTYAGMDAIRRYTGAVPGQSFGGWMRPHWCVGGAVAQAVADCPNLIASMQSAQRNDGSWPSYWWRDDAYATAMCSNALRTYAKRAHLDAAKDWAAQRVRDGATPFRTALLLQIAVAAADTALAEQYAAALFQDQRGDGSWRGSAWLRVPAPDVDDPGRIERYYRWWGTPPADMPVARCNFESLDLRSIFTTATCVHALSRFAEEI